MQHEKRSRTVQKNVYYNRGPSCQISFTDHVEGQRRFPELKDNTFSELIVPLLFRIQNDGTLYDMAVEENHSKMNPSHQITENPEFEREALRLLATSGKWTPYTYLNEYVNREAAVLVYFPYHPEYFSSEDNDFEINPDEKASFIGDPKLYQDYTNNPKGCDGFVHFLVVVEADGSISNEKCLQVLGRTNQEIGLSYLRKLTPWQPALKDGKKVRSQISITIETQ